MVNSLVEYYAEHEGYRCGYCRRPDSNYSHGMWAHAMTVSDYQRLIDRGWRRSGMYCYKPTMEVLCCPMYTIRCGATEFKPSKSQKKIMKKMNKYLSGDRGDAAAPSDGHRISSEGTEEVEDGGGDVFVEATKQCRDVDMSTVVIEQSVLASDGKSSNAVTDGPDLKVITCNGATTNKTIKPGIGHDNSKGPCKKAKQLRLERKMEKLRERGIDVDSITPTSKNVQKQLEDFLEEIPQDMRNKLEVRLVRTSPPSAEWLASSKETHSVYVKYQMAVHGDPPHKCSEPKFRDFLVQSPLQEEYSEDGPTHGYGSFHQQYWLEGRLVAVGVVDILPACVSSVYFFYDPQYRHLTFGTYGALRELAFTRQLHKTCPDIKYYYMGFYIHSCRKMRYKGNFSPSYLLCPETYKWFPLKECIPKLEVSPYCRLNPDPDAVDEDECKETHLHNIPLLVGSTVMRLAFTKTARNLEKKEMDTLMEYGRLVGATSAEKLILYR